jgi:hypothetical protein
MNNNRSHDYENYMNSYGIREIFREAGKARMLREAGSDARNAATLKQRVLRFAPVVVTIAIVILFFADAGSLRRAFVPGDSMEFSPTQAHVKPASGIPDGFFY